MKLFTTLFISVLAMSSYNSINTDYSEYNKSVNYYDLVNEHFTLFEFDYSIIDYNDTDFRQYTLNDEDLGYIAYVDSSNSPIDFGYFIYNIASNKYEYFEKVNYYSVDYYVNDNDIAEDIEIHFGYLVDNALDYVRSFKSSEYDLEHIFIYDYVNKNYDIVYKYNSWGGAYTKQELNKIVNNKKSAVYFPGGHNGAYWLTMYLQQNDLTWYKQPYYNTSEIYKTQKAQIAWEQGYYLMGYGTNILSRGYGPKYLYNGFVGSGLNISSSYSKEFEGQENINNRVSYIDYSRIEANFLYHLPNSLRSDNLISFYNRDTYSYYELFDWNTTPFLVFDIEENISVNNFGATISVGSQIERLFGASSSFLNDDNPLDIFELLSYAFGSVFALLDLKIGGYTLGLFVMAPLAVGFLVFIIHLVKKG